MNLNKFDSNENKKLLWQFFIDNNTFKNINEMHNSKILNIFEEFIKEIKNNDLSLTEKNKMLIKKFIEKIQIFNNVIEKPYQENLKQINNDFEKKQMEYNNLISKQIPNEINFSDDQDVALNNKEIEEKLNLEIENRKLELGYFNKDNKKKILIDESKNKNIDNLINFTDIEELNKIDISDNNQLINSYEDKVEIIKLLEKILSNQDNIISLLKNIK